MNAELVKCSCSHCDGHLEFDTAYAGARITCPHCGKETVLYVPVSAIPPPIPPPVAASTDPAARFAGRLAQPAGPPAPPRRLTAALPRKTNSFARQAARASWVSFIIALLLAAMLRGFEDSPLKPFFLMAPPLIWLIGVVLGILALFGIPRHGTKGILIPAIVGLVLNGLVLGAIPLAILKAGNRRHQLQVTQSKAAASLQEYIRQVKSGAPVAHMPSTGNADIDAGFQIVVDLVNDMGATVDKRDAELARLGERDVSDVLTNRATIKSELGKRSAGLAIIEKWRRDCAALIASAQQKCMAAKIPEGMKQELLLSLDNEGQLRVALAEYVLLRLRHQYTEFNFLQFMYAEFGHYRLVNGAVRFATSDKQEEYNGLLQRIGDVRNDAEAFDRRRSEILESGSVEHQLPEPL